MRTTNRLIATATAVLAIGAVLAGCTSPVAPDVRFSAEKLTISLPTMVVGQALSPTTLPEAMGGKESLVYSLSPAVPGLTFDAATRVLSGTPTTPGTYDMTYTAKDSATGGTMESVTFTIAVEPTALTPMESLIGTWTATAKWTNNDRQYRETWTLTFTPDRAILDTTIEVDGMVENQWFGQSAWSERNGVVTRTWYEWDPEERRFLEEPLVLDKEYYWGNSESTILLMNEWSSDDEPTDNLVWYTRVQDAVPFSLVGTWLFKADERVTMDDEGLDSLSLNSDGTFEQRSTRTREFDGETAVRVSTYSGNWEHDPQNYSIWLTGVDYTVIVNEEPDEDAQRVLREIYVGHRLRARYAATDVQSVLRLSWIGLEQQWNRETTGWEPNERFPLGNYHLFITRITP